MVLKAKNLIAWLQYKSIEKIISSNVIPLEDLNSIQFLESEVPGQGNP